MVARNNIEVLTDRIDMAFEASPAGTQECGKCGRIYEMEETSYPAPDPSHNVKCTCGEILVRVPKGTWDCYIKKMIRGPRETKD